MEDSGTPGSQPGQTITPTQPETTDKPATVESAPAPVQDVPAPPPSSPAAPAPPLSQQAVSADSPGTEAENTGFFRAENGENPGEVPLDDTDTPLISWTASEFIAHAKSFGWYAVLGLAAAVFAALIYLLTKDFVSVGVVLVAALLLGIYAGHQPRQLEYRLDGRSLTIGKKRFGYHQFRSFSVLPEGGVSSIVFMPMKRFAVPITIYYPPEDEDKIVALLADRLPLEEGGHDAIDRLMHRIRF